MVKFKTSNENYSSNERVTAIILLLIQFCERSTLPEVSNQIQLKEKHRKKNGHRVVERTAQKKRALTV